MLRSIATIKPQIMTHRGLEPSKNNFFSESSYEAFVDHLNRGFGIEFDFSITSDNQFVIVHDKDLKRITNGDDTRLVREVASEEIVKIALEKGRLCLFDELMPHVLKSNSVNALHVKGGFQTQTDLDILLENLNKYPDQLHKFLIFDLKIDAAVYLMQRNKNLLLAASVAHPYDIQRYNEAVKGTLLSIEEVIANKDLYTGVWLDEWDLTGPYGTSKQFYTKETFDLMRSAGFKIGLVTPELHGTSPGLLGGEAHPDANDKETLFARVKEIIALQPDYICTDWPEEVREMVSLQTSF